MHTTTAGNMPQCSMELADIKKLYDRLKLQLFQTFPGDEIFEMRSALQLPSVYTVGNF